MPMINCKIELKLKRTKNRVLATAGNDNNDVDSNKIIFTKKDKKLTFSVVTLSAKDN